MKDAQLANWGAEGTGLVNGSNICVCVFPTMNLPNVCVLCFSLLARALLENMKLLYAIQMQMPFCDSFREQSYEAI